MNPRPLAELAPDDMCQAHHLRVEYVQQAGCTPTVETFVCTVAGGLHYAVSIEFGFAYTRPQLVRKYDRFPSVTFTYTEKPR